MIPEGNCIVSIPGTFKIFIDTFDTSIGKMIYHTYIMKDTALNYQLTFYEFPPATMHSDSTGLLKEFFESTIEESILRVKGIKMYESEITQFGYPGWFWRIDYSKSNFIKTKAFMAGCRFYSLQVFGGKNKDDQKKTFAFLDSFQFMNLGRVR